MSKLKNEWQAAWRASLGKPIAGAPPHEEDFILHFDFWQQSLKSLKRCFSIFPNGDKILKRSLLVREWHPKFSTASDEYLISMLDLMNKEIEHVFLQHGNDFLIESEKEKSICAERSVYHGNEKFRLKIFEGADDPCIYLNDGLSNIIIDHAGEEAQEAYFFLREPLYQLSGCYRGVANWIIWALVADYFDEDPYRYVVDLWKMRAQAGWGAKEMFVFIEEEER